MQSLARAVPSSIRTRSVGRYDVRQTIPNLAQIYDDTRSVQCCSTSNGHHGHHHEFDRVKYRPNVGLCVVNGDGLVFAAQRSDSGCNSWQMPQGGIDDGETAEGAALRELQEETSIVSARVLRSHDKWLIYNFPTAVRAKLHGGWERYEGQAQKWLLVHFYGEDDEINLETEHKEFKQWTWMELEDLPGSVVEFKREVYQQVAATFAPVIKQMKVEGALARQVERVQSRVSE